MKDFLMRLSSRKFLIVIATITVMTLFPEIPEETIYLVLAFVGVEGARDIVAAYRSADIGKAAMEKDIALINAGEIPAGDSKGNIRPGSE